MADDLFANAAPRSPATPLTVFRAALLSHGPASWEELFEGCTALKAITFSSSVEFLLRLAERLPDMEVVFGAERILSKEHLAPTCGLTFSATAFGTATTPPWMPAVMLGTN